MRLANFNAGPAGMPLQVLRSLQQDLIDYKGLGVSVMEMSHRSSEFMDIAAQAELDLRSLLDVPEEYSVLFMQGGASAQFSLTVQNLDTRGCVAFANTGYWSRKAMQAASSYSRVQTVTELAGEPSIKIPAFADWQPAVDVSYLHITDNETIDGIEFNGLPETDAPIVADMSSSILSRPVDISRYGVVYAGAQKNIGPAGLTVVIIHNDLLERSKTCQSLPAVFNYAAVAEARSMLNTPPTFAWYAAGLVFKWLLDQGGLKTIAERNRRQSDSVYNVIDSEDAYFNGIHPDNRSRMNIPFHLSNDSLQAAFLSGAKEAGLLGLKGHKSVGGLRASLYNAVTDDSVDQLVQYLRDFAGRFQ